MNTPIPVDQIREHFAEAVQDVIVDRGETTVLVPAERIVEVCTYLRDTEGLEYNFLSDITTVDYYPQEPRFAVCYHIYSMIYNRRIRLKVYLSGDDPKVPSITSV